MRLRTMDGEIVRAKITTEYPMSEDGSPVLVVQGEPYSPEDADFYLESASTIERKLLAKAGYNLEPWSEHGEDQGLVEEDLRDEEDLGEETENDDWENGE